MWLDPGVSYGGLVVIVGAIVSLAFQVAITALGVVVAWRWQHRPGGLAASTNQRQKNAFEILDERYARGEIDAPEYENRRERLLGRNA
jgi:uncharacterized membrane protein